MRLGSDVMPRTAEDVENYLLSLNRQFENDQGTFVVSSGAHAPPVAIGIAGPIVALRVFIGALPTDAAHQAKLYRKLLEYNASDLMHASYGINQNQIVLSAALELENLDQNELEAALSDIDMALARHIGELRQIAGS
jgi:hypothetical protein